NLVIFERFAALVILAIAVLKSLGRTPAPTSRPAPRPAVPRSPVERRPLAEAPPDGPGGSGDLDRTVKVQGRKLGFEMPIDTTYKVLPGRFKVTGGDDQVQEIKLYQISAEPVFTFGRKPGPACRHIRVDDKTVSSKQAELRYANGVFTIQNQSETNPTVVDGLELGVGQAQELMDGSQIVMGEVVLQFEASKRGS
ncbi:MAG: FHA domain-containing protein, partial [Planctomycetota bacterium]